MSFFDYAEKVEPVQEFGIKTRCGDKGYKITFVHNLNKKHPKRCEHKELFP